MGHVFVSYKRYRPSSQVAPKSLVRNLVGDQAFVRIQKRQGGICRVAFRRPSASIWSNQPYRPACRVKGPKRINTAAIDRFLFKPNSDRSKRFQSALRKEFYGMFSSFTDFVQLLRGGTDDVNR